MRSVNKHKWNLSISMLKYTLKTVTFLSTRNLCIFYVYVLDWTFQMVKAREITRSNLPFWTSRLLNLICFYDGNFSGFDLILNTFVKWDPCWEEIILKLLYAWDLTANIYNYIYILILLKILLQKCAINKRVSFKK